MDNIEILLRNNFVEIKNNKNNKFDPKNISLELATIINNFSYYGYVPSVEALASLQSLDNMELANFWKSILKELKSITGADKEMEKFVVYKNFPREVLEKSQAEYWIPQILMYLGFPNEYFTEQEVEREKLTEKTNLKVLSLANENTYSIILNRLLSNPSRWTDTQFDMVLQLVETIDIGNINIDNSPFKENSIKLIAKLINNSSIDKFKSKIESLVISNATDVLRLIAALSEGDISLKSHFKIKSFKRSERRFLLNLLNNSKNLDNDVSLRPELFKRIFKSLRPGDYNFKNVQNVYDKLYNNNLKTFNSDVEKKISEHDTEALTLLKSRPGEFLRRFHKLYEVFDKKAINTFSEIINKFSNLQLLKIAKYLETIDNRKYLMFAPNGNWTKAQIHENKKKTFNENEKTLLLNVINKELYDRLSTQYPEGILLDKNTSKVKLQTNEQEGTETRGTVFDIPENMTFVRSASYWSKTDPNGGSRNIWYDNGWNFFDENWKELGTCCWNKIQFGNKAAIFSGDPTTSKDIAGRGCQMIDLYFDKLERNNVRYAVWNILAYSHIKFDESDVLATLQYGEKPEQGNLYEPSRAQIVFPLKGNNLTKYIAYLDIKERKLVYMDANLYGNVQSADLNIKKLSETMPAFIEYLDTLPSIYDLFKNAPKGDIPVLYTDKETEINTNKAYVFKKENPDNKFEEFLFNDFLSQKNEEENIEETLKI